ncbi:NAD(P)H:quinone oxidoreductase [Erythrobacteraceae bacterium CFH 75059]|uniref:NAD(P)H:quinone oxidoreductase n=1 Tax=Qipengyuania thermophila TaxID=2509361 RepID=UPI00101EB267|nr:NAD(P)H:quinone oxidoreductase [Qipengyuania thermophila]TCD04915.1 NAD(P)H:quinone oxidoreductase [Erythrobacteraceae bacterium CFH 75059]
MARVLVLYYSSYGHTAQLADAVAQGAREAGAQCDVRRVPETAPADVARQAGFRVADHHEEIAGIEPLRDYDAIVVGCPTRYGRMASQMAAYWDQTGALWASDALVGKVGAAFTSTASQHGGQETTLLSILTNLLHMGMTVVGLDYGYKGQMGVDEVKGGAPYGATTVAGSDGSRQPGEADLAGARHLGERVARTALKLAG